MMTMMMVNCFEVWLTDKRRLALFPAGTIVRSHNHRESPTRHEQGLNLRMKLCNSVNHCSTVPLTLRGSHTEIKFSKK